MVRVVILLNRALGRGGLLEGVDSVTGIAMHLLMLLERRERSWEEGKVWLAVVLLAIVILKTFVRD